MPKLNQIIAIEKGVKTSSFQTLTEAHQQVQKVALLSGLSRTYRPKDDEGEQLPPESTRVQVKAEELIRRVSTAIVELLDVTATKDWGNTQARANIVVDGQVILSDVPATYLLFLEKQLVDIHTFITKLPVLDPSETWQYDASTDTYATPPIQTVRTRKIPRNHVKAEATKEHPAQVEVYYEDVSQGTWSTVKYSGALPAQRINELQIRVEKLQQAVKFAREEANNLEVDRQTVGERLLNYIFGR